MRVHKKKYKAAYNKVPCFGIVYNVFLTKLNKIREILFLRFAREQFVRYYPAMKDA